LEHKIISFKPLDIPFYGLIQSFCLYTIERSQIEVEHDALTSDFIDSILYGRQFHLFSVPLTLAFLGLCS
jgi:hypothetical protein